MKGGDFTGPCNWGQFANIKDYTTQHIKRILRNVAKRQLSTTNAGFASLSDIISEATVGGKARFFHYHKNGVTGAVNVTSSLWGLGTMPTAGANAAAAPGGEAPVDSTVGAYAFTNPTGGDTQHIINLAMGGSVAANNLLLYDRIFQVDKTMNSSATESVTGVPTRYQSSTSTDANYAGGNFFFPEVGGTALANTAHNWTVCQYRNQAGTDAQTAPSATGVNSAIARRIDLSAAGAWFMPLASGDTGAMDLAQIQCSALVATGVINFVIGHPIAWCPCPVANIININDNIMTAFNLVRVFDDAALAWLEVNKPATTATTYTGTITTVSG
jgi:hypothetical protein